MKINYNDDETSVVPLLPNLYNRWLNYPLMNESFSIAIYSGASG